MFDLSGKTALVTGSSRGIGKGIALYLAKAGADVIINYKNSVKEAEEVVADIKKSGVNTKALKADVSDENQVLKMFEQISRLDILINNAGTTQSKDIYETEKSDWDRIISINLTSGFLCSKYAMQIMREQNYGRIIFISSVVAERGALFGHVHYAASKSGVIGMAKTLARTGAKYGITVNAIAPGLIETDFIYQNHSEQEIEDVVKPIPLGLGTVDDIGAAAVYLSSDEAKYVTGITLDINGGSNFR